MANEAGRGPPQPLLHRYLRVLVEAGFGKRFMFGFDQMIWPSAIDVAIESVAIADFLTEEQRRGILYENAARFVRLSPEDRTQRHGM